MADSSAAPSTGVSDRHPCALVAPGGSGTSVPSPDRCRPADADDLALLGHCDGPTIDLGRGPGRMTAALVDLGHLALAIDVVHASAGQPLGGGTVLQRDLYEALPGEGRWGTALLADGTVGIGGDPVGLLGRVRRLLDPRGRVVVELAAPGVRSATTWAVLRCATTGTRPLRWSVLGVDDVFEVAGEAGLRVLRTTCHGARWCAVLVEAS